MPTYCRECGKLLPELNFGDMCLKCSDLHRHPLPREFTKEGMVRRSSMRDVRRYSMRDGAITFVIIMGLIVLGLILVSGFVK